MHSSTSIASTYLCHVASAAFGLKLNMIVWVAFRAKSSRFTVNAVRPTAVLESHWLGMRMREAVQHTLVKGLKQGSFSSIVFCANTWAACNKQ